MSIPGWRTSLRLAFLVIVAAVGLTVRAVEPELADSPALPPLEAASKQAAAEQSPDADEAPDQPAAQKTLPDEGEALAGDGGKMPLEEAGDVAEEAPPADVETPADDDGLSEELRALRHKVRKTLGYYYRRKLNTRDHTPWEVFHQIIAYGAETQVRRGGPQGPPVDAVRWLCDNRAAHGQKLMHLARGRLALGRAKGIQGHYGQFLAILAQHDTPRDYPIEFDGRRFTVEDLLAMEQRTCRDGEELTFKLIAFMHYLEPGARWKNERGETWTIERILRDEVNAPIRGAACGGTHRLMGISYAVRRRESLEQPCDGEYGRAEKYLRDFHRYAFSLQNEDGSFSTDWFKGRGNRDDRDRKLQTSGHITEWLAYSVPEEHLRDPRMVSAIDFLASLLDSDRQAEWAIGPLGHALHALALYDERVFIAADVKPLEVAAKPETDKLDRLVLPDDSAEPSDHEDAEAEGDE